MMINLSFTEAEYRKLRDALISGKVACIHAGGAVKPCAELYGDWKDEIVDTLKLLDAKESYSK